MTTMFRIKIKKINEKSTYLPYFLGMQQETHIFWPYLTGIVVLMPNRPGL